MSVTSVRCSVRFSESGPTHTLNLPASTSQLSVFCTKYASERESIGKLTVLLWPGSRYTLVKPLSSFFGRSTCGSIG
ncbi:hypothetical protein D3C75_1259330 [compost metagenome]